MKALNDLVMVVFGKFDEEKIKNVKCNMACFIQDKNLILFLSVKLVL